MSLRIACDLDGTLADMDAALQTEAETLFGPGVDLRASLRPRLEGQTSVESPDPVAATPALRPAAKAAAANDGFRLSTRQQRQLWAHVREVENFWAGLKEVEPGAVARLAEYAGRYGWEVLFITTRPPSAGETTQVQSQRWLKANGFALPSVYVVSGSRGRIAAALTLDAVIDDRPENCLDVATDSEAKPILVWRDSPESAPAGAARLGIDVVFSIADALADLEGWRSSPEPRGFVDRVKNALGM
jgi:hypothetical protein